MNETPQHSSGLSRKQRRDFWAWAVRGTALAGVLYPVVVIAMLGITHIFMGGTLGSFVARATFAMFFGAMIGIAYAYCVAFLLVVPFVLLARWLLRGNSHPVWIAAFIGGMTGWLCTAPVVSWSLFQGQGLWLLVLGPGLAILMGQIGAARAVRNTDAVRIEREQQTPTHARFGLRQLFGLTTFAALVFAVLGALDHTQIVPIAHSLATLAVGAAFQTTFLLIAWAIARQRSLSRD